MKVPFKIVLMPDAQSFHSFHTHFTLSTTSLQISSGSGSGIAVLKQTHISFVFFGYIVMLFLVDQSCTGIWLIEPWATDSSSVQSSAYLHEFMDNRSGIELSMSLIWMLKSTGDITEPWGTPACRAWFNRDRVPASLTCWFLSSKKLRIHNQKALVTFIAASLRSKIPWSARSNALRNNCCRYRNSIQVIYFQINGGKSLSMSFGGLTMGTGVTRVCLYVDEYLHWIILAQIISCTTGASSSQYRLSTHPGIMSDPVAFLGFSSFKAALTWNLVLLKLL